jgi:hypothetical protein
MLVQQSKGLKIADAIERMCEEAAYNLTSPAVWLNCNPIFQHV